MDRLVAMLHAKETVIGVCERRIAALEAEVLAEKKEGRWWKALYAEAAGVEFDVVDGKHALELCGDGKGCIVE